MDIKFNHKYASVGNALGLTDEQEQRIDQLAGNALEETKAVSKAIEKCLGEGLAFDEIVYMSFCIGTISGHQCAHNHTGDMLKDLLSHLKRD